LETPTKRKITDTQQKSKGVPERKNKQLLKKKTYFFNFGKSFRKIKHEQVEEISTPHADVLTYNFGTRPS